MKSLITILSEIPDGNYEGYYWLSNAEAPEVVKGSWDEWVLKRPLPFVVEGNLYNHDKSLSINIRHNGQAHVLTAYDLTDLTGFEANPVVFESHRMKGQPPLHFKHLWREEPDPLCADMLTLKPYAAVFTGFQPQ